MILYNKLCPKNRSHAVQHIQLHKFAKDQIFAKNLIRHLLRGGSLTYHLKSILSAQKYTNAKTWLVIIAPTFIIILKLLNQKKKKSLEIKLYLLLFPYEQKGEVQTKLELVKERIYIILNNDRRKKEGLINNSWKLHSI